MKGWIKTMTIIPMKMTIGTMLIDMIVEMVRQDRQVRSDVEIKLRQLEITRGHV